MMLNLVRYNLQLHYPNNFLKCCSEYEFMLNIRNFTSVSNAAIKNKSTKSIRLPRQPVPDLDITLRKYLRSVLPFLSHDEYNITEKIVNDFKQGNIAQKLQCYLLEKSSKEENWLCEWWLNSAYLEFRQPVVPWSSPGLVFPLRNFNSVSDQLSYAANMIKAAVFYKDLIDKNKISQETMKKDQLDMGQYKKIFGTCRIPLPKRDQLVYNSDSEYIVIIHNNNFFKFNIFYKSGDPLSVEDIYDNLIAMVESSLEKEKPIGIFTTENRDTWAECYKILEEDERNRNILNDLQSSLFVLSLDSIYDTSKVNAQTKAALQTVHGGGSKCNGGNRWFDKTIQFIVNREGEVGLTFEHSVAEGQPVAVMMDFIVEYIENKFEPIDVTTTRNFSLQNKKLSFVISEKLKQYISNARENFDRIVQDLEMNCFTYQNYGKGFIKEQKYSPDSYIQMAQQFAFYRLHKEPGAHYESASTRRFLHGRTETIRSCSVESIKFAQTMLNKSANQNDKKTALKEAISTHKNYAVEAMKGLGVDRHLLGLKLAALELGIEVPKLYFDAGYVRSSHMRISTSQVASKCDGFMCYGPLVHDGYACCYNPREQSMNFAISAFRSCKETNATSFRESLESSLEDMKTLLIS